MLGGLLGQLQNQYQTRPNWMASYNPMWQQLGNMSPSTANSMNLMKWTNDPSAQGSNKLTPNYTGLFGMMGQQPFGAMGGNQLGNQQAVQNDYMNRVMSPQQAPQAPQAQPTGGLIGGWTPAAVQAMIAGAPQNIIDLYQQYPNRSKDMLYWATSGTNDGGE